MKLSCKPTATRQAASTDDSTVNLNARSYFSFVKCEPGSPFGGEMKIKRPRVLLAGISISFVAACHKVLCEEFEIVGTSADGHALMATAIQLEPSVIVLDFARLPLTDVSTRLELKRSIPQTKFLVITNKEDLSVAFEALREWASGVLLRRAARKELLCALRELMANKRYVPASLAQAFEDKQNPRLPPHRHKALTGRQREVLQLLAEGRTMQEAADILRLSMSTIAFHKYKIMRTFGLRSNLELLRLAIRENLTSAE
jgi:DNA-binding NarL/FixJ family response regulator